jgi:hypothetical protein
MPPNSILDTLNTRRARLCSCHGFPRAFAVCTAILLISAAPALAQGGPPLLTNDPGTPGPHQWEVNLAFTPSICSSLQSYGAPQFDFNYGVGRSIQLTFEIPYVVQTATGLPLASGWGNAYPGLKWRFIDRENGWKVSVFPQIQPPGPAHSIRWELAETGPRFLLPVEVQRDVGPLEINFEAGYYVPVRGHEERIIGLAAGRQITRRVELLGEVYNDYAMGDEPHNTTWDLGNRYEFHKGLILLTMAGSSFTPSPTQPKFFAYVGLQILTSRNFHHLIREE